MPRDTHSLRKPSPLNSASRWLGLLCGAAANAVGPACAWAGEAPARADLYVSPAGNDQWSGTLPEPNGQKTDGPFATVQQAQRAVRDLKKGAGPKPVTVVLRGGTYFLEAPLAFTPEDSGTAAAPVVYAAYPGERSVLSGGARLTGWQRVEVEGQGRWQLRIPEVQRGEWQFSQLFVNDERRFRPRLPKEGYHHIVKELAPSEAAQGKGYDRFGFRPGDVRSDWSNLNDVELLAFHQWSMSRLRVGSIDDARNVVTATGPTCNPSYWAGLQRGNRFLVENVKEALDTPGQFYLDRPAGVLTYLPLPGESPEAVEVIAPRLDQLVLLKGQPEVGLPVEYLEFRGLTFAHTNWNVPETGYSFPQAEASIAAAVSAVGAHDCVWAGCELAHLGGYGLDLGQACQRNRVENCELWDLGAGGIRIGTQGYEADESKVAGHNVVRNCALAHGGRMHPAAIGVWIGHSPHNRIEHNDIHDFYYTGLSVGWRWGYAESNAHHNAIERNHVYNIGQAVLSDMGGIYTLGPSPGSVIRLNRFHDIDAYTYGGWGIYFDEGTSDILAENNLVYRTKTGGFHQHYGKENRFVNNILAFARVGQIQRTRPEPHRSFVFERNLVLWGEGPLLHGNWSDNQYLLDRNLYWHVGEGEITFAGMSLDKWREKGQDANSLIADPLFVDPAKDDFRLKDGSPAASVGFVPFDLSDTGRPANLATGRVPADMPRAFPPPVPVPPLPIEEGFEESQVGAKAPAAQTYEGNETRTARVTDETAFEGKHCLKFIDGPDQKNVWDPHVFWDPNFSEGTVVGRFALMHTAGAVIYHEWRDASQPYRVGPSLTVRGDGSLAVKGRDDIQVQLPAGQWVQFEIICGFGDGATGKYSLTVTLPGQQPQRFADLPCDPECRSLRWLGFCAHGTEDAVFYLDGLALSDRGE